MNFQWPRESISSDLSRKALRQSILEQIYSAKSGHPGGSLSLVEIIAAIFDGCFEHDVKNPNKIDRDRLVLSKGHGVPALYSAMSFMGYFAPSELKKLRTLGHFLQGHPDRHKYPLMEASTGSLGQGVSVALGEALGLRLSYRDNKIKRLPRVYSILGDGEMQEGQVWECLMAAGKFRPGNLIFILDFNKGQIDGPVAEVMNIEPIEDKLRAFNWNVKRVDGHDVKKLNAILKDHPIKEDAAPLFIVADTVKGKGVPFMENQNKWHGSAPNREQLEEALGAVLQGSGAFPFGRLVD
ncbi:MAG: transketolase [Bdellovibrionales bacterium]|nr:transketolase [Bdellovibrionales bacterium]